MVKKEDYVTKLIAFEAMEKPVPAWYGLTHLNSAEEGVLIHPDVLGTVIEDVNEDAEKVRRELNLPALRPLHEKTCGFGNALRRVPRASNGWTAFCWAIPEIVGEDEDRWQGLLCITATLKLIFRSLYSLSEPVKGNTKQLMVVEGVVASRERHGDITVGLTPQFCDYLGGHWPNTDTIVDAMRAADAKMYAKRLGGPNSPGSFRCWIDSGRGLHLVCPGQATSLNPEADSPTTGSYTLMSSNVDSAPQTLTLMAALCEAHDQARIAGF